jgi:hypothetical protein
LERAKKKNHKDIFKHLNINEKYRANTGLWNGASFHFLARMDKIQPEGRKMEVSKPQ